MSVEASMSRNLNAARALAAAGCPVFPLDPGTQEPRVQWTECSTTNIPALETLWQRYPDSVGGSKGRLRRDFDANPAVRNPGDLLFQ